jgi:hypothetical protein
MLRSLLLLLLKVSAIPMDPSVVDHVNAFRAMNGAAPLMLDATISATSQAWADHLASTGTFVHSSNGFGENIAKVSSHYLTAGSAVEAAVDMAYAESAGYDFLHPGYSSGTGHFTQLVWVGSKRLGIGAALSPTADWWYVVLNFDPPGNYVGVESFRANVRLPVSSPSPTPLPPSPLPKLLSPPRPPSPKPPSPTPPSPKPPSPTPPSPSLLPPSPKAPLPSLLPPPSPKPPAKRSPLPSMSTRPLPKSHATRRPPTSPPPPPSRRRYKGFSIPTQVHHVRR